MKALTYTHYGSADVLHIRDVETPTPGDDEILIRIFATTVNRTDCATIRAKPFFMRLVTGLLRPRKQIPGTEFSGEIAAIGKNISSLKVGDKVFGFNDMGSQSHAEYTVIPAAYVLPMPASLSYSQAAACFEGAHYAYNFLNKVPLKQGQDVLVNGATGAIGSAAVQLLKYFGVNITAVCATNHIALVKSLGADRVIDYLKDDFTEDRHAYHFVFDTVGKSSFFKCKRLLKPGGVYMSSDLGYLAQNLYLPLITAILFPFTGKKSIFPAPTKIGASLAFIKRLIEEGKFTPVIDREFAFEDIIEAYRYVEKGMKTGNVVIRIDH